MLSSIINHEDSIQHRLSYIIQRVRTMGDALYGGQDAASPTFGAKPTNPNAAFDEDFRQLSAVIEEQFKVLDQQLNRLEGFFNENPSAPDTVFDPRINEQFQAQRAEKEAHIAKLIQTGINYR